MGLEELASTEHQLDVHTCTAMKGKCRHSAPNSKNIPNAGLVH